jgi:hypothetical protein
MKTLRFYQLYGEQKLDAISQMSKIIIKNDILLPSHEEMLAIKLEQGYDPNQDFNITLSENDELKVELK